MNSLQKLITIQKNDGYTNYEMSVMMEIPKDTWKQWKYGRRTPRGPSVTIIKWVLLSLQGNPITRQQLLAKTGRIGRLTAETTNELKSL